MTLLALLVGSLFLALADPTLPDPHTSEGKLAGVGLLLSWIAVGLWNRRGTKTVENKTDQQTGLLLDLAASSLKLHSKVDGIGGGLSTLGSTVEHLRKAQEENDALTTDALADMGADISDLKAGHAKVTERLARVEGTVAAMVPTPPKENA